MNPIMVVLRKELMESLRDRRVVIGAFVVPIFLIFMMTKMTSALEKTMSKEAKFELTVVGSQQNPLVEELIKNPRAEVNTNPSKAEAVESLRKNRTNLVLEVGDVIPGQQFKAKVYYDGSRPMSLAAFSGMRQAVSEANAKALRIVMRSQGIDAKKAEPMSLESVDVTKDRGMGSSPWTNLLPYLIILWSFYGGINIVSDLVAGEKERKTLETLLLSPCTRGSIVAGKYLALAVICLASGLMSLVGLAVSSIGGPPGTSGLGLASIAAFLMVLIPQVLLYAGVLLSVSALAKTMRECQTYLTLVSFLVMVPAISSQFVGFTGADKSEWVTWTPILNTALVLTQALKDQIDWSLVAKSAGISLVLALLAGLVCVQTFNRESILKRT